MAAQAVGAVVAVGGMFFGIPPQYGYMLGSMAFSMLNPEKIDGPKLADLKVITSQYGLPIPNVYGAVRISGNVIWSIPLVQVGTTDSQKGGPKVTTYKQYAYFALGLCEGPIDGIGRIWINSKLFSSNNKNSSVIDIVNSSRQAKITVYKGDEEQMPDPLIVSHAGKENVNANRGLAYLVFDGIEYPQNGLNIEVEVFKDGQVFYVSEKVYEINDFNNMSRIGGVYYPSISQKNQIAYLYGFMNELDEYTGKAVYYSVVVNPDGTTKPLSTFNFSDYADATFSTNCKTSDASIFCVAREKTTYKQQKLICYSDGSVFPLNNFIPDESFGFENAIAVKDAEHMFIAAYDSNTQQKLCRISFYGKVPQSGISKNLGYRIRDIVIGNNYVFVLDNLSNIRKYDLDLNYIGFEYKNNDVSWYFGCLANDNDNVYAGHSYEIYKVSNNTKTFVASTLSANTAPNLLYFQNDNFYFRSGTSTSKKLYVCAKTTDGYDISVAKIVKDLCKKSGLLETEIETNSIEDKKLRGYFINGVMATGSSIEQLANYYFFDNAESDDKIKFVARGKNTPITIPEEDLAAHITGSELPDDLAIVRKQSLELPEKLTLKFMDTDADYQITSTFARRNAVNSQNTQTTECAVVQTQTQARKMADRILRSQWTERRTFSLQLPEKYLFLEVNDVLRTFKDGDEYIMRVTEINYQNSIISITAVEEDLEIYDSFVAAAPSGYRQSTAISTPSSTDVYFLDIPLLRDQDDGVGYYVTANGFQPNNWTGTQLYKSLDNGASFLPSGSYMSRRGIFGPCKNILGKWEGGNNLDVINTLRVKVNGTLNSTSRLNLDNGANYALVGKEIIQYQYAELQEDGTYLLYHLYRGCNGTEQHINTHTNGDVFIDLSLQTLYLEPSNTAEYGLERYFKALSDGENLNEAFTVKFTNNAVAQKPYAPCQLGGGRDGAGNTKLKWTRRTRTGGTWRDSVDVPLGETTEAYSVDILKPDGKVVRTIDSTVPFVMYTAEQQTADFGSVQSSIKFTVYQISSTVGRGFGATETI